MNYHVIGEGYIIIRLIVVIIGLLGITGLCLLAVHYRKDDTDVIYKQGIEPEDEVIKQALAHEDGARDEQHKLGRCKMLEEWEEAGSSVNEVGYYAEDSHRGKYLEYGIVSKSWREQGILYSNVQ